jgi:hypothetical protein
VDLIQTLSSAKFVTGSAIALRSLEDSLLSSTLKMPPYLAGLLLSIGGVVRKIYATSPVIKMGDEIGLPLPAIGKKEHLFTISEKDYILPRCCLRKS